MKRHEELDPEGKQLLESIVCIVRRHMEAVEDLYFNTPTHHPWSRGDTTNVWTVLDLQFADFSVLLDKMEEICT